MTQLPDYLSIVSDLQPVFTELKQKYADGKWVILVDENTEKHCLPLISNYLPKYQVIQIQSGETNKNLETCAYIWQQLTDFEVDRKGLLINLGGGVIGDMGGFCASTYKRGISFVNMPTTLLSQVDASIGGKLGIDFHGFKNHIGLFRDPDEVIIFQTFLNTLPERELRSGFAEIIKHHLIQDTENWNSLKTSDWNTVISPSLLRHSIEIKSAVVMKDPFEKGLRKILNYGHTVGHAIETHFLAGADPLLHGEAIAAGMVIENFIAEGKQLLNGESCNEINGYILRIYGKAIIRETDIAAIIQLASQDKKNQNKEIRGSLLKEAGIATWDVAITQEEMRDAINRYRAL
ncbi:3-dehydroquinate synthase [Fulvivirga sedimenti]|uniref:3-dehydroquinate synthase n=1 Tax=Fulvivirga sedimenti TaxID=2879465 RepID=A0A9X1HMH8_9BACT|nr:3-dehydroquinate synthase [Fulvivirga sedimenti]MCA6074171.1 3-dehydroquinate synthase [Fulvivirga sedimenti]